MVSLAARRKGSVLEAFMLMLIKCSPWVTSSYRRVYKGSYMVLWEEVYSDTLRKPKNAVVMAAQIIILSSYRWEEWKRLSCIVKSKLGVMGRLLGRENLLPSDLLMPLMSR